MACLCAACGGRTLTRAARCRRRHFENAAALATHLTTKAYKKQCVCARARAGTRLLRGALALTAAAPASPPFPRGSQAARADEAAGTAHAAGRGGGGGHCAAGQRAAAARLTAVSAATNDASRRRALTVSFVVLLLVFGQLLHVCFGALGGDAVRDRRMADGVARSHLPLWLGGAAPGSALRRRACGRVRPLRPARRAIGAVVSVL